MSGTFKPADASADARGDKQHPGSQGYTCEKPLRLQHYQGGPHRLDTPMRRRPDGTYESIGWDAALDEIATRLQDIRRRHGGQAFGFYGGGGQGNHHHDHPSLSSVRIRYQHAIPTGRVPTPSEVLGGTGPVGPRHARAA